MFEHSLIDLEEKQHPRRRWAPLPIAIGLHVVVLASVALVQAWDVEKVGAPDIIVPFVEFYPEQLPAPPPPQGGSQTQQTETTAPTPETPVRQPDEDRIPDSPSTEPAPEPATGRVIEGGSPFGSQNGVQGGLLNGQDGGVLDDDNGSIGWGGPVVAPEPQNEIVRFDGSMTRPVMLSGRQPRYTELARRAGIQGVVILEAVIDKQGRVTNVRLLKPMSMGLDEEAIAAVKSWVFEPAKMGGRPVAVYYTLTVNFQIQR
jgi:protein TonB